MCLHQVTSLYTILSALTYVIRVISSELNLAGGSAESNHAVQDFLLSNSCFLYSINAFVCTLSNSNFFPCKTSKRNGPSHSNRRDQCIYELENNSTIRPTHVPMTEVRIYGLE